MRDNSKIFAKAGVIVSLAAMCFALVGPVKAKAGTVAPDPSQDTTFADEKNDWRDSKAVQEELDANHSVTLESGKTYYFNKAILLRSGDTFDATGATIYCKGRIFKQMTKDGKAGSTDIDYGTLNGVTVTGGTWLASPANPYAGSSIQFAYANNLNFKNMTIKHAQAEYHTFEFVACNNVRIDGCTIEPINAGKRKSVEEQIQIDQATKNLAAFLPANLQNGTMCSNIVINDCTVTGCRAVCANLDVKANSSKFFNKYHKNITVSNCKLTGTQSEALMLFNTKGITVTGNTITSNAPKSRSFYASGLRIQVYGKGSGGFSKGKVNIKNNTISGKKYGIHIQKGTSKTKFGKVTISGNNISCKSGKNNAIKADFSSNLKLKNNTITK